MNIADLKQWYQLHREQIHRDFLMFLSFPSISTDKKYEKECRKTAQWLCDYLQAIGMEIELWETTGLPVVFATHLKAGPHRPTVLLYHHYDVQPVDPLHLWHSEPFKPVIKDNVVFARGAEDNKGQCYYSLIALKAFLEQCKKVNVNIKLIIEGEEESGGAGTFAILPHKKDKLKADHLLVIDSGIPARGVPGITLGVRGIVAMEVECTNSSIDLHSGILGGAALNPNRALISVLAKLWDSAGRVTVPGFYDDVAQLSREELSKLDIAVDKEKIARAFGIKAFALEAGYSIGEAIYIRPTLEINGISGGYTGEGFKTVIPSKAFAKISCRLVPAQDPTKIGKAVEHFLQQHIAPGIELKVTLHHGAAAFRSSAESFIAKTVRKVYEEIFEQPCLLNLSGGSIPIVIDLEKASGAEVVMMGMGLDEDNIHAPNEHFGLDQLEMGFIAVGRILTVLSEGQ